MKRATLRKCPRCNRFTKCERVAGTHGRQVRCTVCNTTGPRPSTAKQIANLKRKLRRALRRAQKGPAR